MHDRSRQSDPAAEVAKTVFDVAVIGAGPAGTAAAIRLARLGRRVLLVDRAEFPRKKVCGDGLLPDARAMLDEIGLLERVREKARELSRIRIYSVGRVEVNFETRSFTLPRRELDALLFSEALAAGARFMKGFVEQCRPSEKDGRPGVRMELRGSDRTVFARFALIATGAGTHLLRKTGRLSRPDPSALAMRGYVRSDHPLDALVISYDASVLPGYAWIFPMAEGRFNVGCGVFSSETKGMKVDLKASLERFLTSFPLAAEILERGERVGPVQGGALRCGLSGADLSGRDRMLVAGDAAGTTFHLTGEGVGKAMRSGWMAADYLEKALQSGEVRDLEGYGAEMEARFRSFYRSYEAGLGWLRRPWFNNWLARKAARSEALRQDFIDILHENLDPGELFSVVGILKRLFA